MQGHIIITFLLVNPYTSLFLLKAAAKENMHSPQSGIDGGHLVSLVHQLADKAVDHFPVEIICVLDPRDRVKKAVRVHLIVSE